MKAVFEFMAALLVQMAPADNPALYSVKKESRVKSIVLKTGPNRPVRPVQPGTGLQSGPVMVENRK